MGETVEEIAVGTAEEETDGLLMDDGSDLAQTESLVVLDGIVVGSTTLTG